MWKRRRFDELYWVYSDDCLLGKIFVFSVTVCVCGCKMSKRGQIKHRWTPEHDLLQRSVALLRSNQKITSITILDTPDQHCRIARVLWVCHKMTNFLRWWVGSTSPNPQAAQSSLLRTSVCFLNKKHDQLWDCQCRAFRWYFVIY